MPGHDLAGLVAEFHAATRAYLWARNPAESAPARVRRDRAAAALVAAVTAGGSRQAVAGDRLYWVSPAGELFVTGARVETSRAVGFPRTSAEAAALEYRLAAKGCRAALDSDPRPPGERSRTGRVSARFAGWAEAKRAAFARLKEAREDLVRALLAEPQKEHDGFRLSHANSLKIPAECRVG